MPRPHYHIVNGAISRQVLTWRVHKGNASVDVTLSECTATEWATLENTASQAAFDTAAATIWGNPYSSLGAGYKAGMRQIIGAGLP